MKRYLILILVAIFVLASGVLVGCTRETQPDTELEEFNNRLVEFYQKKMTQKVMQFEQVETELANLKTEIPEIESELARKIPAVGVHQLTPEELAERFVLRQRRPALEARLAQLQEQEQSLLATKQSLQRDIEELEQLLGKD